MPASTPAEIDQALAKAQDILLGYGVTARRIDEHVARRLERIPPRGRSRQAQGPADELFVGHRSARRRSAQPTAWLYGDRLRAVGHQIVRRRRARIARRVAEAALCRQAGHARAAIPFRCGNAVAGRHAPRRTASRSRPTRSAMRPMRRSSASTSSCAKISGRPALADRAFPDRRSRRHPAPRAGRDHRLDAADPPDQRPADGREAARAEPARRRLCVADGAEDRRAAGVRIRLPGRNRPIPSPACQRRSAGRT